MIKFYYSCPDAVTSLRTCTRIARVDYTHVFSRTYIMKVHSFLV